MRSDIHVVLGGVGLVKGNVREAGRAMVEITKELNPYLVKDGFLDNVSFKLLNGIMRFGTKNDPFADMGPINTRSCELPFAVEVEIAPLKRASNEEVKVAFLKVLIPALFAIAAKYDLPINGLRDFSVTKGFNLSQIQSGKGDAALFGQ